MSCQSKSGATHQALSLGLGLRFLKSNRWDNLAWATVGKDKTALAYLSRSVYFCKETCTWTNQPLQRHIPSDILVPVPNPIDITVDGDVLHTQVCTCCQVGSPTTINQIGSFVTMLGSFPMEPGHSKSWPGWWEETWTHTRPDTHAFGSSAIFNIFKHHGRHILLHCKPDKTC